MFKYSKLTKGRINKLIDCFLLGLPALQIARYTGLHRNTVNRFFKKIRVKIANHLRREKLNLKRKNRGR